MPNETVVRNGLISNGDIIVSQSSLIVSSISGSNPHVIIRNSTQHVLNFRIDNGGTMIFAPTASGAAGSIGITGGLYTSENNTNGGLTSTSNSPFNTTVSQYRLLGATSSSLRLGSRGSGTATLGANSSYGSVIFGEVTVTAASTGTHPMIASLALRRPIITSSTSIISTSAMIYIEGAMSGALNNYSIWSANTSASRFDGKMLLAASTSSYASLNIPTGSTPTSPIDGDIWTSGSDLYIRLAGTDYKVTNQSTSLSDGNKGDITVSGGGTVWNLNTSSVELTALADIGPQQLLGRYTTGSSGSVQTINISTGLRLDPSTGNLVTDPSASACFDVLATYAATVVNTVGAGATRYITLNGSSLSSVQLSGVTIMPVSGYLKSMFVLLSGSQPATGSLVISMMKGNNVGSLADTALSMSIAAGTNAGTGSTYSNTSASLAVNAGDLVGWKLVNNAGSGSIAVGSISVAYINTQ